MDSLQVCKQNNCHSNFNNFRTITQKSHLLGKSLFTWWKLMKNSMQYKKFTNVHLTLDMGKIGYLQNRWICATFPRWDQFSYTIIRKRYFPHQMWCVYVCHIKDSAKVVLIKISASMNLNKHYFNFHVLKHVNNWNFEMEIM